MQAKVLGKTLTLGLVAAVPALAIAFLGSPFTSANVAGSVATAERALATPTSIRASEPVANVQGENQGETVLDSWTFTGRPISKSS